jgi:VWFA-related protein
MAKYKRLLFICLSVLAATFLWSYKSNGQDKEQNKEFVITSDVDMVNVPVTLRKSDGDFLKGVPQKAFHIFEDGEEQEIVSFAQEAVPVRIALVLDISGSVKIEWGAIKYSSKKFLANLAADDEFALLTFGVDTRLKMDWGRQFDRIDPVLGSIYCNDPSTKIWDAIWVVSTKAFKNIREKKAMIIMTDGLNNESAKTYTEALEAAIRSEAAVYVVSKTQAVRRSWEAAKKAGALYTGVREEDFFNANRALNELAEQTGGRVLYPNTFGQLDDVYAQVDEELKNQYSIGYMSNNEIKDGSYRHIEVRVEAPGARVSARPGYYAPDKLKNKSSK